MSGIRTVEHAGVLYALVRDGDAPFGPGIEFVTPREFPLQVGIMRHPEDTVIRPHIHRDHCYQVSSTQEFILVERGLVEVVVYTAEWDEIETLRLGTGAFILFVAGGHGLTMIEESQLVEVKQGPYPGDAHAKTFRDDVALEAASGPAGS